jgi:hypothetical protein
MLPDDRQPRPSAGLDAAVRAFRATLVRLDRAAGAIEASGGAAGTLEPDGRYPLPQPPSHVLAEAAAGEARSLSLDSELGERAALLAVAGQMWHRHLGPLLTSRDLQKLGDRSRQAVHDLVARGRLLALPARGGSLFPAFQVDRWGRPRPGMAEVLAAFEGSVGSPLTVASWFRTPQPLLDHRTPADWLVAGDDVGRLVAAARRAAAHLRG